MPLMYDHCNLLWSKAHVVIVFFFLVRCCCSKSVTVHAVPCVITVTCCCCFSVHIFLISFISFVSFRVLVCVCVRVIDSRVFFFFLLFSPVLPHPMCLFLSFPPLTPHPVRHVSASGVLILLSPLSFFRFLTDAKLGKRIFLFVCLFFFFFSLPILLEMLIFFFFFFFLPLPALSVFFFFPLSVYERVTRRELGEGTPTGEALHTTIEQRHCFFFFLWSQQTVFLYSILTFFLDRKM